MKKRDDRKRKWMLPILLVLICLFGSCEGQTENMSETESDGGGVMKTTESGTSVFTRSTFLCKREGKIKIS